MTVMPSVHGDPALPSDTADAGVRVRVNVWAGCVAAAWWQWRLDTVPDHLGKERPKCSSERSPDDVIEGSVVALATDNVIDVMLTTADVYAKVSCVQFKEKHSVPTAFLMVDWSRGADGVIGSGASTASKISYGQNGRLRSVHAVAFSALPTD